MNPFVTHITKTLALLAVLLLPVQSSMAATCCCHRGINQSSLESTMASQAMDLLASCCSQPGASCCSQQSLGSCCCHTRGSDGARGSDGDSQPCRCPSGCRCTTSPDAIAFSAEFSSEWDFSASLAPSISANACQDGQRCSRAHTEVSSTASGATLCVLLCRYQL